jgi:16S rRNA (cytosine1402-N4)-methyltransferase
MIFHQPVLVSEVIKYMNLTKDRGFFCDCTAGGAGHLLAMLKKTKKAKFLGIEWDRDAFDYAEKEIEPYQDRCFLFRDNFINLGLILKRLGIASLNGIMFDLGVSFFQLMTAERGFSYKRNGALLMTMNPDNPSLLQRLKNTSQPELVQVLKEYGDVRQYRRLGAAVYARRKALKTTYDLRQLIEETVPKRFLRRELPKVFQAFRIWVNNELVNLEKGLCAAVDHLEPEARIAVISYHSGEDRIVKNMFRRLQRDRKLLIINKKVIRPSETEVQINPRARSAKLRVGEKCVLS